MGTDVVAQDLVVANGVVDQVVMQNAVTWLESQLVLKDVSIVAHHLISRKGVAVALLAGGDKGLADHILVGVDGQAIVVEVGDVHVLVLLAAVAGLALEVEREEVCDLGLAVDLVLDNVRVDAGLPGQQVVHDLLLAVLVSELVAFLLLVVDLNGRRSNMIATQSSKHC